jgi:hypothetical protein
VAVCAYLCGREGFNEMELFAEKNREWPRAELGMSGVRWLLHVADGSRARHPRPSLLFFKALSCAPLPAIRRFRRVSLKAVCSGGARNRLKGGK